MPVQSSNPDQIFQPPTYFQVSVASGTRTVYIAGQVAIDKSGALVGKGDLAAQSEQIYRNLLGALAGVGATFADVAKLTIYVVDWTPDKMEPLIAGAMKVAQEVGFDPRKPLTMIGVSALSNPDFMLEVEAIAVLP